jgi:hypothetical protein
MDHNQTTKGDTDTTENKIKYDVMVHVAMAWRGVGAPAGDGQLQLPAVAALLTIIYYLCD